MKLSFLSALLLALVLVISGCEKEINDKPAGQWLDCIFIINEGPFQGGSGSVSAFNRFNGQVSHNLFVNANGRPLGNIVQSMSVFHDMIFIVVHNSNKIEVAQLEDFKSIATIDDLVLPRYFIGINDEKAYVSCWDKKIREISLTDFTVVNEISTGAGPDEMVFSGERLFVINSGGFDIDSTVTFININHEEDYGTLEVGHRPAGIAEDFMGNIWVLCSGKGWNGFPDQGDTPAKLVCFDPVNLEILRELTFPDSDNHPYNMVINDEGTRLYYNHPAGVFAFSVISDSLPLQPFIPGTVMFYGMGFDPDTRMICLSDPLDYAQNGWIYLYSANDGALVNTFMAGISPNGFCFN